MAEEEKIIEHAKKAVHVLTNKEFSWQKKVREFLFEILIIVIAVSLTLWFHNMNDQRHDRQLEKNFLTGIKEDLKKDTAHIDYQMIWFQPTLDYYDTLWEQIYQKRIDSDYIDNHSGNLTNTIYSAFDNSRFESFRSSGNLKLIENKELSREITHIFATELPFEEEMDQQIFDTRRQNFGTYIGSKAMIDSTGHVHISKLLNDPAVSYQIFVDRTTLDERKKHQQELVKKIGKVIADINKELHESS